MTNTPYDADELRDLLIALLENTATPAEQQRLEELLLASPEARTTYVRTISLHGLLDRVHASPADLPDTSQHDTAVPVPTPSLRRRTLLQRASRHPKMPAIAIAVAIMLMIVGAMAATPVKDWVASGGSREKDEKEVTKPQQPEFAAKLTNWHNAVWLEDSQPPLREPRLEAGSRLVLASGYAQVAFYSGAVVLLEGPVDFTVEGKSRCGLRGGKLVAKAIEEQSKGFIVDTPMGEIEDLGTEFGVEVAHDGRTRLEVFDGEVRMRSHVDTEEATIVLPGGRLVADARGMTRVPSATAVAPAERFVRSLGPYVQRGMSYHPQLGQKVAVGTYFPDRPPVVRRDDLGASATVTAAAVHAKHGAEFLVNGQLGESSYDAVRVEPDSTVTLTLDTSEHSAGYDISEIATYAGWNPSSGGRSNQGYEIQLTYVDGSTATLIGPDIYAPNNAPSGFWTVVMHTNLADGVLKGDDGVTASGVKAITWRDFSPANAGGVVVYREFDVVGVPTRTDAVQSEVHDETR